MRTPRERRRTQRVQLQAQVSIQSGEETIIGDTDLRDVSLDALSFRNARHIPIGTGCIFEITITGPSSLLKISGKGRIIRKDRNGTVLKFSELDIDSYLHLKNIILLNRTPD